MVNRIAHGLGLLKRYIKEVLYGEDYTTLSVEEKKTYDGWEAVLTKEVKLPDLRNFVAAQMPLLGKELREAVEKGEERRALKTAARLQNFEALLAYVDEPDRSRENLINHISNLLESNNK